MAKKIQWDKLDNSISEGTWLDIYTSTCVKTEIDAEGQALYFMNTHSQYEPMHTEYKSSDDRWHVFALEENLNKH